MPLVISSPATLLDMAELGGARSPLTWEIVKEMLRGGETFAAHEGRRLVGIAGLYPLPDGEAEAWFSVRPDAGRFVLPIVRHFRLTAAARPYRAIVTVCVSAAGQRIAAAAGFRFVSCLETGELWAWQASSVAAETTGATWQSGRRRRGSANP